MKKYCFLLVCVLLFTGCGSRTLKCSRENNYSDEMKMIQKLDIKFKSEHIKKLAMDMNVELGDEYLSFKDSLITSVESEFSDYSNERGVSYSTSDTENGFNFKLKVNFNKLSDDLKKSIDIVDYEKSYDSIKNDLEESGYICK